MVWITLKERISTVAVTKTTYKVVAPAGVFVRLTPHQEETNVVRIANNGERIVVVEVLDGWVRTEDGYVMNDPYIIQADTTTSQKGKEEAE
jgi:hypothetical protein